jgi:hypothetical protein
MEVDETIDSEEGQQLLKLLGLVRSVFFFRFLLCSSFFFSRSLVLRCCGDIWQEFGDVESTEEDHHGT